MVSFTEFAGDVLNSFESFPNVRLSSGVTNRNKQIMTWRLPNNTTVQMYINPQNFVINESKQINYTRTKGGFVVQYWGDNLTEIRLEGTTGSSGVKGINVLRDIYRAENKTFDVIAKSQANELFNMINTTDPNVPIGQIIPSISQQLRDRNFILRPSLASIAVGIILYYQGVQYKGFFTNFSVTESVNNLGLFDYSMTFMATETRGKRDNFMPWHREPIADDAEGQLLNAFMGHAANAARSMFGLASQQITPQQFHPDNAPLSFGGSSFASTFGIDRTGIKPPAKELNPAPRIETSPPDNLVNSGTVPGVREGSKISPPRAQQPGSKPQRIPQTITPT